VIGPPPPPPPPKLFAPLINVDGVTPLLPFPAIPFIVGGKVEADVTPHPFPGKVVLNVVTVPPPPPPPYIFPSIHIIPGPPLPA
jgi:hypothetical protein